MLKLFTRQNILLIIGILVAVLLLLTGFNLFDPFQIAQIDWPFDLPSFETSDFINIIKLFILK